MADLSVLVGNPTKEKIVEVLSASWPLTAKKVYNILKKDYRLSLTYQATYKAIGELLSDGVIEKSSEGYQININWLKKIEGIAGKIKNELTQDNFKKEVRVSSKITFNHYGDFLKFLIDFMGDLINKEPKLNVTFHYRHIPNPSIISEEDINKLRVFLPKINWLILSKKDTPVGRWNAKQWAKLGVKTKIGADIFADSLIVVNDYILNLYTRKESINAWDGRVKELDNYIVRPISDDSKRKNTVVLITKDQELANIINQFAS